MLKEKKHLIVELILLTFLMAGLVIIFSANRPIKASPGATQGHPLSEITADNDFSMGSHKITNLTDPTANSDAATKGWVLAQGDGGAPTQILGRKQLNGVWEVLAEFGYYNATGACDINGGCYYVRNVAGVTVVFKDGVEFSGGCVAISNPLVGGHPIFRGDKDTYCNLCQGGKVVRSWSSGSNPSACICCNISGCICDWWGCDCIGYQLAQVTCCSYWYDALKAR